MKTTKLKAIILDDEERARNVMQNLLQQFCPDVEIVAICSNVPDAVLAINKEKPDVVFSDIEMPNYSGFELLSFFREVDFEIIFATGYSEYAMKAFEVSAVDYLLKPIQIDKLEEAVAKLKTRLAGNMQQRVDVLTENLKANQIQKIALPMMDGLRFVSTEEIVLFSADGAYTTVHLSNSEKVVVSKKIGNFESVLKGNPMFFRVHRSSIVNIDFVIKYSKAESMVTLKNELTVNISREKKALFEEHIRDIRI